MLTLTRQGLLLSLSATVIPSQGSSDVPVAVVNDINTYVGYTLEPRVGYYLNGIYKSTVCTYDTSAKTFSVPAEAFKQIGIIDITLALIDNTNANHIETCQAVHATVNKAPLGTVVLPDQTTWQDYVNSYINQLFDSNYKPQFDQIQQDLENLVTEAQQQQQTAEQQQTQIDNAISVMGEYQIVSNDPVQIQFKQGDGTFGPTVDLGDGLASKSMVNAGYYQSIGSQYSGSASDYGIEVEEIVGAYTQETTTGAQKIDLSKVADTASTTHTLTDTGMTITGRYYVIVFADVKPNTDMYLSYVKSGSGVNLVRVYNGEAADSVSMIIEFNNVSGGTFNTGDNNQIQLLFYSGQGTSETTTYNDVMLCEGTSAKPYEPYTGGAPSPNPDYAQEMQAVEIGNLYSVGKNFFDASKLSTTSSGGVTLTNNGDGSFTVSGSGNLLNTLSNVYYDMSYEDTKKLLKTGSLKLICETVSYPYFYLQLRNNSGSLVGCSNVDSPTSSISVTEEYLEYDDLFIRIGFYGAQSLPIVPAIVKPMIYQDGDGTFEPYVSDTVTLSEPLILRALPNGVADSYEDGVITRRVGVVEFDGSADENWSRYVADGVNQYSITLNNLALSTSGAVHVLSDKFKPINVNDRANNYNTVYNGASIIGINTDLDITTVKDWKTWLQSNPITVWYELATPTTEQLAIPTLQSFYPFTNAWCDSIVQPQQITWNVLTGKSSILDGNGNLIQQGYMTPQDNLLINSDFRSGIINQKGQTQYVHSSGVRTYGIDCWYVTGENSSMAINDKFLSLNLHNNGDFGCVLNINKDYEKYFTFTIQRNLVEAQSVTFDVSTMNENQDYFFDIDDNTKIGIYFWKSSKAYKAWFYLKRDGVTNIDFMKLERGKYFTGMPVWNEAEELLKCQRYLFSCHKISGYGFETGGGNVYIYVNIPTPMGKQGAISVGRTLQVIGDGAYKTLTINGVNVSSQDNNLVILSGVLSEVGNLNIVKIFEFTNFTLDAYDY